MKYIDFSIDIDALHKNGLNVYQKTDNGLVKVTNGDFVILNGRAELPCDFMHPEIILTNNVTPKQLRNIIFFEVLKAFRR